MRMANDNSSDLITCRRISWSERERINAATTEDLVQFIDLSGEEYLFYKSIKINVALIRGTAVGAEDNLTMDDEVGSFAIKKKVSRKVVLLSSGDQNPDFISAAF